MSQNHRCAAPTIDPTQKTSLFEVPLPNRRPLALNPGGFGRQHVDRPPFDAPMRLFDTAIP